jgi:hypothetical protein
LPKLAGIVQVSVPELVVTFCEQRKDEVASAAVTFNKTVETAPDGMTKVELTTLVALLYVKV